MPSIFELVHESASDLKDRARDDESVKVSLTKNEHIEAFADEPIGEKAMAILSANRDQLQGIAEKKSAVDPDQKVASLKEQLLRLVIGAGSDANSGADANKAEPSGGPRYPDDGYENRKPRDGATSHYDDPSTRWKEIGNAAQQAAKKAVDEGRDYMVVERMEPNRETEPLSLQPSYMGTPEDGQIVFEAHAPSQPFPIINTSSSPSAPIS